MSDIIRNYIETQGTPEEKEDYKQMNFAKIWLMENGANMPSSLLRGALFDSIGGLFKSSFSLLRSRLCIRNIFNRSAA